MGCKEKARQYGIRSWSKGLREGTASSAVALEGLAPPSATLLATFRHEKCRLLSSWLKITDKRKTQERRQKATFYYHSAQDRAKNITNKPAKHHDALLNVKTGKRNIPIKANDRPRGRKYAKEKGLRRSPFAPSPRKRHADRTAQRKTCHGPRPCRNKKSASHANAGCALFVPNIL